MVQPPSKSSCLYFSHGVRFQPKNTGRPYENLDGSRRVIIDNLPSDTHLSRIMERIWGGRVVSAVLLDMPVIVSKTTKRFDRTEAVRKCAVIEFARPECAITFARQASSTHPIGAYTVPVVFGNCSLPTAISSTSMSSTRCQQRESTFSADIVRTKSYPMSVATRSYIKQGFSRYIQATNFNPAFIMPFLLDAGMHHPEAAEQLLHISLDGQQTLHLYFSTLKRAVLVYGVLTTAPKYGYGRPDDPNTNAYTSLYVATLPSHAALRDGDGTPKKPTLIWGRDPCDRVAIVEKGRRFSPVTQDPSYFHFMQRFHETISRIEHLPLPFSLSALEPGWVNSPSPVLAPIKVATPNVALIQCPPTKAQAMRQSLDQASPLGTSFRKIIRRQGLRGWEVTEADHWKELESLA
ncbi:hypothetical protein Cpir12675_005300 [Ceratocystis pirilliformis]|uniref:RRM domain-containing protein n=1 Tax=Ceratocystis pirilliformis TaxID=259994 RepID=A0ABR3YS30_9PEZI